MLGRMTERRRVLRFAEVETKALAKR